jgi:NitT/TauT family transport system substrate-binding protein
MEMKGQPVRVFSLAAGGYDPYTVTVATRREYLESNRELCAKFVRATREGWSRYLKEPSKYDPSLHALNPAMSLKAMAAAAVLQHELIAPPPPPAPGSSDPIGWMTTERWQRLAEQMKELELIKAVPADIGSVFWNAPLAPASPPVGKQ